MYTKPGNKILGKFEGAESQLIADVLYNICENGGHNEEISAISGIVDFCGLIKGKKHWFIVYEDNQGFF